MAQEWRKRIDMLPGRLARLVEFLRTAEYEFASPERVLPGPPRDAERHLERLERLVGSVPSALAYFYRTVGSVDLRGEHRDWHGCELSDPLVIEPIEAALEEAQQYAELENPAAQYTISENGVYRAPIAPDDYHKADMSGGMWLGVEIPNSSPDPIVLEERHGLPLTLYIDLVLSWGGFLGLETTASHSWPLTELQGAANRTH